ncbi:DUF4123 domain-containing protein [sulfur-oxidizing endosymbiont of Gigantopelta aegis]|uniref:DUF4123 domain-containing protein n=1 Tax=sulfur-oxidizing endosymbiont of Gigantopelta aegis TaxID=2794934 RepID=UPI0018DDABE6|nr:DUF4123 domain-containing protein [sulfur-oxidizing endosymbiont of Gigantopelta aegis]
MKSTNLYKPITTIHQTLLNNKSNVYVLIDISSAPELRGELFNLTDSPQFYSLFHGTVLQELRDQSPFLLQIELNQYQYLNHLFDHAPENFMIIFSQHSLETLYQHWQSLLSIKTLKGEIAVFKFYTTQILAPYLKACTMIEQTRLLAFCDNLYIFDAENEWSCIYQSPDNGSPFIVPINDLKKVDPELKTAWWQQKIEHFQYLQSASKQHS